MPDTKQCFPLSLSQKNIWNLEQVYAKTPINNISSVLRISGRLDIEKLSAAINCLLESNLSLRTRITVVNGEPMQYHVPYEPEVFQVFDFSMTDQAGLARWEEAVATQPMQLLNSPLYHFSIFKTGIDSGGLLVKTHHIISDGWSQVLLANLLSDIYLKLLSGQEVEIEPLPDYRGHVEAELKYLSSPKFEKDREYWSAKLNGFAGPSGVKDCRSAAVSPVGKRKTYQLSATLNHAIRAFCEEKRIAPFSLLYMALAIYLRRIGGADQISIGVPVFNRNNTAEKNTTGMFVSTLPLFAEINENQTPEELIQTLLDEWYSLLRHQSFPFSKITEIASQKRPDISSLFHIVLSFQNSKIRANTDASVLFEGRWTYSGYQSEHLIIHLSSLSHEHCYSIDYDYLTQFFSDDEIDSLHGYLVRILRSALDAPQKPIWSLPILDHAEEEKLLFDFNRNTLFIRECNICEAFDVAAEKYPSRVALIYEGERMTYAALKDLSERYAAAIYERIGAGEHVVALALEKGFDLVAAMLGAARSGNAWVIVPPSLPPERFDYMLSDSGARLIIANCTIPDYPVLSPIDAQKSSKIPQIDGPNPNNLAYIVYTSGSTGRPKGVEIEQISVINFARAMEKLYGYGGILSLSLPSFDVFLLESLAALINGRTVILARDGDDDPDYLAGLIKNFAVGVMAMTPSRLKALLKNPSFAGALRNMESIICGGEHLSGELVSELKLLTGARIYNQYGPSETTIGVSYSLVNDASVITVGKPMPNCRLYVLDNHMQPLPMGFSGELYIGGICVGRGYRNAPELTATRFFASPFEPGERIYRTGDIACWDEDGNIRLSGRKDDQVKLRGLRIEPSEISAALESHPLVNSAVVRVWSSGENSMLVGYYTSDFPIPDTELFSHLLSYLPNYMLPSAFIRVDEIPLTPNGKADFRRLPDPVFSEGGRGPQTDAEKRLLEIFKKVLSRPEIGVDSDYFLFGGDSLNALETLCAIENEFGVRLKITDLYSLRTVRRLAQKLGDSPAAEREDGLQRAPELEFYPLTPIQESIYFQSMVDSTGVAYNMPGAFRLPEGIDATRLENAFKTLISSEEVLRTSFALVDGKAVQKICPSADFAFEDLSGATLDDAMEAFVRPFDLSAAPLMRAALWRLESGEAYLLIDIHHIISDGISTPLLLSRLDAAYRGEVLAKPPVSYKDYAYSLSQTPKEKKDGLLDYWKKTLEGFEGVVDIPFDRPRPKELDYAGSRLDFSFDECLTSKCEEYLNARALSPYMFFAGVFALLLSKMSGTSDITVGTPVSGRVHAEQWEMLGAFINTLPLRLNVKNEFAPGEYFDAVKTAVFGMLDHQKVSLEDIISAAGLPRLWGQNPLYNTLFEYRPLDDGEFSLGGGKLQYMPAKTSASKLDFSIEAYKKDGRFNFVAEYSSALFDASTIEMYAKCFTELARELAEEECRTLSELSGIPAEVRDELIESPNLMRTPYLNLPVDMLIERIAARMPNGAAVRFGGNEYTFAQFAARARALAGQLQRAGIRKGDRVAVCCRRGFDMLAALVAILKTGASYVPFLSSYPAARINYMLEIADVKLIFCDAATAPELEGLAAQSLVMTDEAPEFTPVAGRSGSDEIYVLFTSGSTGKPKGVSLPHRAISNLIGALAGVFASAQGRVLCTTNIVFDIFMTETLATLALGRCVVMADEEEMLLPWRIAELIKLHDIKAMQMTPSRLAMCLNDEHFANAIAKVGFIILAGEAVTPHLMESIRKASPIRVWNMYGPTEAAVYVTKADVAGPEYVTIGKALQNCRIYLLDENLKPVPPCARGDLYIAGECLANGYVGRDDLTAECFIDDPFFPGERMYKSGDIARLLPDGNIAYIGRKDKQIKLNGQRVELDEITGQLLNFDGVADAAVVAKTDENGARLRGFIVAKNGVSIDIDAVKKHLASQLPKHMVPSEIVLLPEMPRTASGKIASKELENYEIPLNEPDSTAIEDSKESTIEKIWRSALGRTPDPKVSFFEQGGSSLAALAVLSEYYKNGWEFSLSQFYDNPTLEAQRGILGIFSEETAGLEAEGVNPGDEEEDLAAKRADSEGKEAEIAAEVFKEANAGSDFGEQLTFPADSMVLDVFFAEENTVSGFSVNEKNSVLVTGATGFLGAHIVNELLENRGENVICAVRGGSKERFLGIFEYYFGRNRAQFAAETLTVIDGNVSQKNFGIEEKVLSDLSGKVCEIIHAAADVRHYAQPDESLSVNLGGAVNAIALAKLLDAKLSHISTVSICGSRIKSNPKKFAVFSESDLDIGQNWEENIYLKGKFLAEREVLEAVKEGLKAQIFRIGRLVGRASDGMFQKNPESNAFFGFIKGLSELDVLPASYLDFPVELTAVDECARAVVALRASDKTVFHVFNPNLSTLSAVAKGLGLDMRTVPLPEFEAAIRRKITEGTLMTMAMFVEAWRDAVASPAKIRPSTDLTLSEMKRLGLSWTKPDPIILLSAFNDRL